MSGFEPLELFLAFALQYGPRRLCDGVAPDVRALAGCGSDAILMSAALGALAAAVVHLLCSRRQTALMQCYRREAVMAELSRMRRHRAVSVRVLDV